MGEGGNKFEKWSTALTYPPSLYPVTAQVESDDVSRSTMWHGVGCDGILFLTFRGHSTPLMRSESPRQSFLNTDQALFPLRAKTQVVDPER